MYCKCALPFYITICILPHTYVYVLPGACELLVPRLTKTCIACEHKCLGALISQCCYCNISNISADMHAAAFDQQRSRILGNLLAIASYPLFPPPVNAGYEATR